MGFRSSDIETTSSWSLWKTTREFIEKARRAAVVNGGLPRSANPGQDPTVNHHVSRPEGRAEKENEKKREKKNRLK